MATVAVSVGVARTVGMLDGARVRVGVFVGVGVVDGAGGSVSLAEQRRLARRDGCR